MEQKTALVTGISGQDGAYLARLLIDKGYKVYGTYRRSSTPNFWRLEELGIKDRVNLICMELTDETNIQNVVRETKPDEFYNLAAQSFVQTSFTQPIYTGEVNGLSVAKILESLRAFSPETRFYQASTSELFGKVQTTPQNEKTPFYPRSPYGVAKLYAHWMTNNFREAYNLFACAGILFNHESPLRGPEFVTRKVTMGFANMKAGKGAALELGNLDAKRDWGFAGDYVKGMWLMLQQEKPDEFVLATGVTTTIRRFVELAAQAVGMDLEWQGEGVKEIGVDKKTGKTCVRVNPQFFRPAEVELLLGDASKAKEKLGWQPETNLEALVRMMIEFDLKRCS